MGDTLSYSGGGQDVHKVMAELRATLYGIGDGVIVTDAECRITRLNPVAETLTGWKELEAKGRHLDIVFQIVNEETGDNVASPAKGVLTKGESLGITNDNLLISKDGTKYPISDCASPIFDDLGCLKGVVLVFRDQSAERAMQQALKDSEELHRITIENIQDPVFITDDDGVFTFICPNVQHILGYSPEEMKAKNNISAWLGDGTPLFDSEELERKGEISNIESEIINKDGTKRHYLVTVRTVAIKNGTILYVCRDITERKQVENERRSHIQFLENLEKIDRAIKQETDVEKMLWAAVKEMLSIFDCDRVWLLHPCDPDAEFWRVPVEVTRPEYPGAYELGKRVPMTPDVVATSIEILNSDEPIAGVIRKGEAEWDKEDLFGVRSFIGIAIRPQIGKPWELGMHQCSYPREWSTEEKKLFKEIGRRIEEALSNVLFLRNLKESEALLKETQSLAKIGGWVWERETSKVVWTDQIYEIYELPIDPTIDHIHESLAYLHPDDKEIVEKAFWKATRDGTPYDLELRLTTAKGNKRFVRTMGNPVKSGGKVIKVTGNLMDVTEARKAEQEEKKHLRFLENLELIDQAIKHEPDMEKMLHNVLEVVFRIFESDRAWLLFPCDPDAESFRIPVEVTHPDYPGGKALNHEILVTDEIARDMHRALESRQPVIYSIDTAEQISKETAEQYGVKTEMFVAVYPKLGKPWLLGLHQCSYLRVWQEEEQTLLKEISRRIEDALSSVLFLRDLRDSEALLKETQELAKVGGWVFDATSGKSIWTDEVYKIHELSVDQTLDHMSESLKCYHSEDRPVIQKAFSRALEEGRPYDLELRLLTAKGHPRWVRTMGKPVKRNGKVVKIAGNLIDITQAKKAKEEQRKYIGFLESLERIDQALRSETDVEKMLHKAVKTTFDIFDCDRAWLLYPADPDAPVFKLPVEVYKPEYPGGGVLDEVPMDSDDARNIRDALSSDGPYVYTPETIRCATEGTAEQYSVKALMLVAIYPKIGRPWVFGLHQCSYPRRWTGEEQKLFNEISRRISDALSNVLFLRDLKESEENFRATFEYAPVGIAHISLDGYWLKVNQKFCDILGYSEEEFLQKKFQDITYPDDAEIDLKNFDKLKKQETSKYHTEKRYICKDGSIAWVDLTVSSVCNDAGEPAYFISVVEDITSRKQIEQEKEKLQKQLLQAQKMESVGRLAGGVAHDFNNILSVILGYADMALERFDPVQPVYEELKEIRQSGQRAADLTRQLLAFARKQTVSPEVLKLNDVVGSMLVMLQRLIGENIDLAWLPHGELWLVKIDAAQVDQILANLCVNARDAIEGIGRITIETTNTTFSSDYCFDHPGFVPGEYVQLTVSDDGCGMEKEIVDNLFEPFFTTKPQGEGTGLGLSTVYGIVKQNDGFINIYSEPGEGTSVKIYFPKYSGVLSSSESKDGQQRISEKGHETILLVEDEPALLKLSKRMLENLGYKVITADTPNKAIALAREHVDTIDLLITDVIMPEMNGHDLCEQIASFNPDLKHLFMSGYTANIIAHHGVLEKGVSFIQKPFSLSELSKKVREVLEQG